MRISREEALQNRERVLIIASELFRSRGFDGVAIGEVMQTAGLTHGGFYNHFSSKEDLACKALDSAWRAMAQERSRARGIPQLLRTYLSEAARNAPGKACPAAALAGDVARQSDAVKEAFGVGLNGMIDAIAAGLNDDSKVARAKAIGLVTRMVGALMLSRAVPDDDVLASDLLKTSLKACLSEFSSL